MKIAAYRKLVAAAVGMVAVILGPGILGITPGEEFFGVGQDMVVQIVLGALGAAGVWGLSNEPAA